MDSSGQATRSRQKLKLEDTTASVAAELTTTFNQGVVC
jgi:hypothetical protein